MILILFDNILIKRVIVSLTLFVLGEIDFQKILLWVWLWNCCMSKNPEIQSIGFHTWWNIQVREKSTSTLEREKALRSLKKYDVSLRLILEDKDKGCYQFLCTLCIGITRWFHLHFTLMFFLRSYKMVQSL